MFADKKFGISDSLLKAVEEATKKHTVPKTDKEKDLAALAEPKDKITHKDVLVGRGVAKEEVELGEASEKKEKQFHVNLDKLVHKTFGPSPAEKKAEKKMSEGVMDTLKKVGKKIANAVAPDDETLLKDLQKKAGVPETGKKPMAVKNEEAGLSTEELARIEDIAKTFGE